ncbi:portal protein [Escherichia coli]
MAETTKERLNKQFAQLESERQSFEPHWRELSDYINPRGSRFLTSEVNRNDRRNTRIIDSTGAMAARTLASGMMSGITSPARPWFRLATPDPEMMDYGPVKLWLEAVQNRMNDMFNKSNLYQSLPQLYGSLGTYSTGAMAVLEDDEDIIRTMPFPIGSYYLANSPRGSVDTCFRKFSMTVRQLVQEFGLNNVSESVKSMWESGTYEKWIEVMHSVYPKILAGVQQRQAEAWQKTTEQWAADVKADKEIGGDKLISNLSAAQRALDQFGTPELKEYLNTTGLGNHPDLVKTFVKIGKAMSEDGMVTGGNEGQRSAAEVLYGK